MKSNKLKKIIAIAVVSTMVSTIAPITASAAWLKDSQNNWNWTENGNKATGWKQVDGTWYHFDANGKMQTGWVQTADSKWYYLNSNGGMKTGWIKDTDGKWYKLAPSGEMRTGWIQDTDGKWYFADISGAMQTGIIEVQGKVYVLEASGAMATGSTVIGGATYKIDASGAIVGDKLPIPDKAFTKEGTVTKPIVTSNAGTSTTGNTNTGTTSRTSSNSSSNHNSSSSSSSSSNSSNIASGQDLSCDVAGTYGPDSGVVEVNNVSVNAPGVTLKNMHIKGDLVLGEGIAEGDVYLNNVTVDGTTTVQGGGENSVHFIDSALATVIVNKNNGKIRIVVQGNSQVLEVQLESPAKLEESDLDGGATGFNDVNVTDNVQTGNEDSGLLVELIGSFETINSRATSVRIQLDEGTNIQDLILNVLAQVLGTGTINTATINSGADGSTLYTRPGNMILHASSVSLIDQSGNTTETIDQSYSNAESAAITGIKLNMNSIKVSMDNFVAGLTSEDFNVSAKLGGEDYTLQDLSYDADSQRFTFDPVPLENNIDKLLQVTVGTNPGSVKVTGEEQSDEITVQNGFLGRITDIQEVGIAGVTINFRLGSGSTDGDIVATAVTDEDGYYTVNIAPGEYTGEISGSGIIKTYMYASSLTDSFNTDESETAIRATGMDSLKVVLTWGANPSDEDSHLEGPIANGGRFHTWYSDQIYQENGIRYADLDWDDTSSYGPETTTIYKLVDGKYRFYVHNFSGQWGDTALVNSGAKVQVYKGSSEAPINTVIIPNDTSKSDSLYWLVFDMNVVDNGETINVSEINELRENMTFKIADTAETSYAIYDGDSYTNEDGEIEGANGEIEGVPSGTIADLKADLSAYDGGTLKVLAAGTDVYDATNFDAATELTDTTALANGQIVAVKAQDGTIKAYTIMLAGTIDESPVLVSDYLTQNETTTSGAVILTWNKATDDTTSQSDLKYSLYVSEDEEYGDYIEDWEDYAILLIEDTDINSYEVTGLSDALDYYFKLIVEDADGNKTAYTTEYRPSSTNNDGSPVLVSDFLTQYDTTTPGAITLTWDKATDNATPQEQLKYSLYMSENKFYNTIENWENNAELLIEDTDIDSVEVSGLKDTSDYYFQLIVEDAEGNKTEYTTESRSSSTNNDESPVLDFYSYYLTQNETTTPGAVTLTWNKATDNATSQEQLKYSLYMSENYYDTIEDWENNAELLIEDTDIDSFEVSGLNDTSSYYFQLIVEDVDGNKTKYSTEHRLPLII